MKNIDLTYLIPVVISLMSFIIIVLRGGQKNATAAKNKQIFYLPLVSVIGLIAGVIIVTFYYERQLQIQMDKFEDIKETIVLKDSLLLDNQSKAKLLDSLFTRENELRKILSSANSVKRVTGENLAFLEEIKREISATTKGIGEIETYNEIIPIPGYLNKGYMSSGNTSNFEFYCPTDKKSDYIDLKLKFADSTIVNKIDIIYIAADELKNDTLYAIFSQAYKPQYGINAFKIRNYLKNRHVRISVGYILKSETGKDYPKFEKVTCGG